MAETPAEDPPLLVTDAFLGGQLQLRQPAAGHRCGTDAVLLAAAAPGDFSGLAIDAGAGVGAAGLALAVLRPGVRLGLLENDSFLAGLARANLLKNGLPDRGFVVEADLLSPASRRAAGLSDESAGLVISNPPFFDPGRARLSPDPRKRRAHAMSASGPAALAAWIAAAAALVAPGGLMILVHRPDALPVILESLAGRAGGITILPVYPRREAAAGRVLVRGKKGSRAPLSIAPPLVLHEGNGFTSAAEAIHRGALLIDW
ncbi:MAG TPA: methyltransferase [Methylocella sp.]|nr:methyltransferase [Methylocella sp.]